MEKIRYENVPAHSKEITEIFCDICGEDVDKENRGWRNNVARLEADWGEVYPECDCRDGIRLDFCVGCMRDKVIPLIEKTYNIKAYEKDHW